jgi:hypothetical protein
MGRYELPDPRCNHKPMGRVTAGDLNGGPHVSTYVCNRPACVQDALEWAYASTHINPEHHPMSLTGRGGSDG